MKPYYAARNGQIVIFNARWEEVYPTLGLRYEEVALLWADPPYGIDHNPLGGKGRKDWARVAGDDQPFDPASLLEFPRAVLWGGNHYASRLPDSSSWWTWDKREGGDHDTMADCEHAWTNLGGPARLFHHLWRGAVRKDEREPSLHPTKKPVALATWGFQRAKLKSGDLVFSPYMGSGPEARAALDMGLRFIGCEIVEQYCNAAVNRLKQRPLFAGGF